MQDKCHLNQQLRSVKISLQCCFETVLLNLSKNNTKGGKDTSREFKIHAFVHIYCRISLFFRHCSLKTKTYRVSNGSHPNLKLAAHMFDSGLSEVLGIFPNFTDSLSINIALQLHKLTKLVHYLNNVSLLREMLI